MAARAAMPCSIFRAAAAPVPPRSSDGVSSSCRASWAKAWNGPAACRSTPLMLGVAARVRTRGELPFWASFGADRTCCYTYTISPRNCMLLRAKRKFEGRDVSEGEEEDEEIDEDLRVGLNEISTEALKVMLSEDDKLLDALREKVDNLGEYLVEEDQLDAAQFMLVLRGMLDHEVYPQKDNLKSAYKKAFDKIATIIEDSGWVLKQPGADVGGVEMVDDELMPPVLNTQY